MYSQGAWGLVDGDLLKKRDNKSGGKSGWTYLNTNIDKYINRDVDVVIAMSFSYRYKELACIIIKKKSGHNMCSWQAGNPEEAII